MEKLVDEVLDDMEPEDEPSIPFQDTTRLAPWEEYNDSALAEKIANLVKQDIQTMIHEYQHNVAEFYKYPPRKPYKSPDTESIVRDAIKEYLESRKEQDVR